MTSIGELGQQLRSRQISCVELCEQTIARVKTHERFHSFITPTFEAALSRARELDREFLQGRDRGPLHGIPIAIKDNFYTRGVRTTAGSKIYADFCPDYNADVVERLEHEGAVSLGKTNMHELAFGITSKNPHHGFVLNPHDSARISGGSSGGSAALIAAGLIAFATGTDTGGSIRIPASYCGVVGFKPSYGRVSRRGTMPLSFSLDTVGPLGASVNDCEIGFRAIANRIRAVTPKERLTGLRVGVPTENYLGTLDTVVQTQISAATQRISALGAQLELAQLPDLDEINAIARMVQLAETAALYASYSDSSLFGADVWALIEQGRLIAAHEYVNAQRLRSLLRQDLDRLWNRYDVLITPTTPVTAPPIASDEVSLGGKNQDVRLVSTRLVRAWNLLGEPAISLPCGLSETGLPVGLQVIAAPGRDEELLQIASLVEAAL